MNRKLKIMSHELCGMWIEDSGLWSEYYNNYPASAKRERDDYAGKRKTPARREFN
jgi:hypothetical protein